MALLVVGGLAAAAFLITRLFGGGRHTALMVWVVACGVVVALPLLVARLARLAYTRIAAPLADVIAAADALAEGDLTARVAPHEGEFGGLAHSFNRMAEELEAADQRRRRLTADVAHELRTPLQIIQGNLEGVIDGVYQPSDAHVQATLDETRLLARLIDDLRTLSLAEAGQLPLQCERVNVADLLADIETSFSGQAEALDIDLTTQANVSENAAGLYGDVGRLDQVLGNLVANALRYTPAGGAIVIAAEMDASGTRLAVRDSGGGIAAEDLPHVFDRFWKGDPARTRSAEDTRTRGAQDARTRSAQGARTDSAEDATTPLPGSGSGLGLAIVRQLVRAHGGEVTVRSALGEGAEFVITLPPAPADPESR